MDGACTTVQCSGGSTCLLFDSLSRPHSPLLLALTLVSHHTTLPPLPLVLTSPPGLALHHTVLHRTIPYRTAPHRTALRRTALHCPHWWNLHILTQPPAPCLQRTKLDGHPMFERISDAELEQDPAAGLLAAASEEAQKVARNQGSTWRAVYCRLAVPRTLAANPEKLKSVVV